MSIDPNNLAGTAHLTFDDEFNALSLWSPSNPTGTWATTFWYQDPNGNGGTLSSNGEQEWYINSNYAATSGIKPWTVASGILTLTATPVSSAVSSLINGYGYTSGELNSYHSFSQTYGLFEMRAELPAGQGFWPAFWLMPENGAWPPELDVMETIGSNPDYLVTTVHTDQSGSAAQYGQNNLVGDTSAGYHTYAVDWEPDYITWYFDGQAVFKYATPSDMNSPMYIIANLADGGYWPGAANGTTGQLKIDWIRAYASGAGASTATNASASSTQADSPAATGGNSSSSGSSSTGSTSTGSTSTGSTSTGSTSTGTTGQTYTSDNAGDHWTGTSGADTFNVGRGGDVITGGGGADTFKFAQIPWAHAEITDFSTSDVISLTGMFASVGYTGTSPLTDGRLQFISDGNGGTAIWFNATGLPLGSGGTWEIADLDHVTPSTLSISNGLITESAAGSNGSTSTGTTGQTYTSDNAGDHWTGASGADIFNLGRGGDVVTGNGGADTFKFAQVPWAHAEITDFSSLDVLSLTAMFASVGYTGSSPLSDGHLQFVSDGNGGTQVWFNANGLPLGSGGTWEIVQIDHVAPASLTISGGQITEVGGSASTGTTTTTTGQTYTSDNAGDHWTGTSGADTFNVGRGGDVLTGNGGNDTFAFNQVPWAHAEITDFNTGDQINLSNMFASLGYGTTNPVADGRLSLVNDGQGNTDIWFNASGLPIGSGGNWEIAQLDHVTASSLHVSGAFITG